MKSKHFDMSTATPLILYDLPTKKPGIGCWSPNVWKTRLLLNYKNIPYTTQFVTGSEIESTLSALGIPPNPPKPEGVAGPQPSAYTVPAVKFPDGSTAMDSAVIAPKIEQKSPEPKLDLAPELQAKVMPVLGQALPPMLGIFYPRIQREVLIPETVEQWTAKKEAMFGMSFAQFEAEKGGETAWKAAQPGHQKLKEVLKEIKQDDGPFVRGKEVCYVDFILGGLMVSLKRLGEDLYERMVREVPALGEIYEEIERRGWIEKDD